ncbi:hypothetical protein [Ruminococcus sp.]|uniref:hypothetical protein n=1 Tax=Ruminococcus sp. TaxID=41978 RepID=UPI00388E2808
MTVFEANREWLVDTLESYRSLPSESAARTFIDRLIEVSRNSVGTDGTEKQYHNLIVLQYIADTRLSVQRICGALHIGRQNYKAVTANAIDRLMILAFGVDGMDWEYRSEKA